MDNKASIYSMAILYKHFTALRTVLLSCFLLFGLISPAAPQLAGSVYTVSDVTVDVTADNALKAREQAFEQAQQQAFKTLSERLLDNAAALPPADTATISTLIQDYEITQEKLSTVRYIGTYTFRFRERAVKQYFSGSGQHYTDVSSRPVLVLPYFEQDSGMSLWSPYNRWLQAWGRAGDLGGLVPVVVPLGDLQDVRDIGESDTLSYNERRLQDMLMRYGAGEAVMAVALMDESESGGDLTIDLYRTDRARPEYVNRVIQPAKQGQTPEEQYDDAVRAVYQFLQRDWKARTGVNLNPGQQNVLQVRVPFRSLSEWTQTRRALERVQGVDEVKVKSLSPTNAQVELSFRGDERRLRLALEQVDITLTYPRFSTVGAAGFPGIAAEAPQLYELYLNRYAPGRQM